MSTPKILILGATGMLGHTLFEILSRLPALETHAALRRPEALLERVAPAFQTRIHAGVDAADQDSMRQLLDGVRPDVLINCIGMVKQLRSANDPLALITANALLPHRLAQHCSGHGIRLIHFSTDCVFSGARGHYSEADVADPADRYGCSKLLGEPMDGGALTLRTSIIGHELHTNHGLLEWFLGCRGSVDGFRRSVFSGLPTVEIAHILSQHILPSPGLVGIYHVAAEPISKLDLLRLIADRYGKRIDIMAAPGPAIDRSLDATRFNTATGYSPPPWPRLIDAMLTDAAARYPRRQFTSAAEAHVAI